MAVASELRRSVITVPAAGLLGPCSARARRRSARAERGRCCSRPAPSRRAQTAARHRRSRHPSLRRVRRRSAGTRTGQDDRTEGHQDASTLRRGHSDLHVSTLTENIVRAAGAWVSQAKTEIHPGWATDGRKHPQPLARNPLAQDDCHFDEHVSPSQGGRQSGFAAWTCSASRRAAMRRSEGARGLLPLG